MSYKIEIERVQNGFIIRKDSGEKIETTIYNENENLDKDLFAMRRVLWEILEYFDMGHNKHAESNIKIKILKTKQS